MDADTGSCFALDPIGAVIWQWLDQPLTLDQLCLKLLDLYEVEPEVCRADVARLLDDLLDAGLVEARGSDDAS